MIEISLDTFITLYKNDHRGADPLSNLTGSAIEHLDELRKKGKAMLPYFDHDEGALLLPDSDIRWEWSGDDVLPGHNYNEYLVVQGFTESDEKGWPIQVWVPMEDWYKVKVVIF